MSNLQAKDVASFLNEQRNKGLLRFITCGSVDDGKSTLIGRLLFESKAIFDDQLASLESDSRLYGTQGDKLDLALLAAVTMLRVYCSWPGASPMMNLRASVAK